MDWLEDKEYEEFNKQWAHGEYDNPENGCEKCGRFRVCKTPNGKHRCEKCDWCPELQEYITEPS